MHALRFAEVLHQLRTVDRENFDNWLCAVELHTAICPLWLAVETIVLTRSRNTQLGS
jgi:hypothetical protein